MFLSRLGIRRRGDGDNKISLLLPNGSRIVGLPAIAVLERATIAVRLSFVTYEWIRETRSSFRYLERLPFGLDYPAMVEHVRRLVHHPEMQESPVTLVMDATGVGRSVMDLLRVASLPCRHIPVTITGGDRESHEAGAWRVPKRDLITGLLVLFQGAKIDICGHLPESETLVKELANMRIKVSLGGHDSYGAWREGEHDDLVLAAALAC